MKIITISLMVGVAVAIGFLFNRFSIFIPQETEFTLGNSVFELTKPRDSISWTSEVESPRETLLVARVIDGDTIEIEGGKRVRYLGIDTPEAIDPRKPAQCFGREASARNRELVEDERVRLVADVEDRDKYRRLLRYVYLPDGRFVNLELIKEGYATAYTFPPNVAHAEEFRAAERSAREARLGLWAACPSR